VRGCKEGRSENHPEASGERRGPEREGPARLDGAAPSLVQRANGGGEGAGGERGGGGREGRRGVHGTALCGGGGACRRDGVFGEERCGC